MTPAQWTALRRALLLAGHSAAEINAAWQAAVVAGISRSTPVDQVGAWLREWLAGRETEPVTIREDS
jgi:hypothetical protein